MNAYPHYPNRLNLNLDGAWDFGWLGDTSFDSIRPDVVRATDVAAVPGVFDTMEAYHGKRGVALYQLTVRVPFNDRRRMRLNLGALGMRGRVWWDGEPLGDVVVPYSSASFDVDVDGGRPHRVSVAVDNRFDAERSPLFPPFSDFYAYGGIFRHVELVELPAARIERVVVSTVDLNKGKLRLDVRLAGRVPDTVSLRLGFDDKFIEQIDARPVNGAVVIERNVPNPRRWSLDSPALHTVTVGIESDMIVERFGLRTVATKDGAILLNGEPVRLMGVNRHEAHPQCGPVQTTQLMINDLQLIKSLGCNFVRAVHYPHDPAFLDLCDQVGLLVWEESLAWGLPAETLVQPTAREQLIQQTTQMVREGINHPSVIIWAFLNECASESELCEGVYIDLTKAIRAQDATRLVSYASNRGGRDRCFKYVDVVSLNLYPGWIHPRSWDTPCVEMIAPNVREMAELSTRPDVAGKPMVVTEIGAAALYGFRDRDRAQWSEEFQADFMAEACRSVLSDPRWAGVVLWQFCDTRSFIGSGEVRTKPRGFNGAGLLDEYRRPKLSYDAVRAIFRGEKKV